jgi:tryptophan synthase alpha subunit
MAEMKMSQIRDWLNNYRDNGFRIVFLVVPDTTRLSLKRIQKRKKLLSWE